MPPLLVGRAPEVTGKKSRTRKVNKNKKRRLLGQAPVRVGALCLLKPDSCHRWQRAQRGES